MDVETKHGTVLHAAASEHDLLGMESILKSNQFDINKSNQFDINSKDFSGRTPLHCILDDKKFDDIEQLENALVLLKEYGADINIKDYHERTPLHCVFSTYVNWIPDIVTFCYRNFPEVDLFVKNRDGYTIFHMFSSDVGDDVKDRGDLTEILQGRNYFIEEFINGNIIEISSQKVEKIINEREISGYSAFQTYIDGEFYSLSTIKLFIQKGADVNSKSLLGNTALMKSALRNYFDILETLLQSGADPNATNVFEQTALFSVRSTKSFLLLSDYGAKLDVKDRFGRTAVNERRMFIPEDLPLGGISLESNFSKFEPLAELFFKRGFNPNERDKCGATLLHYASWWADDRVIHFLLDHGASPNECDSEGRRPYDLAQYHGNFNVAHLLLSDDSQKDDNALRKHQMSTKYRQFTISPAQADDMASCFSYLGFSDDPSELISLLLEFPVYGLTSRKPEADRIKDAVDKLMINTANKVSEMDTRFRCTVRQTGSAAEGTKTCEPSEFDYVFCLDFFAEECDIVQPDELLCTGFGYLKIKQNSKEHPLSQFTGSKGFIESTVVRITFEDYVVAVLNKPEIWNHKNIYFDGLCKFPSDKPVLQIQIQWFGSVYKQLYVDIDIVTGIVKDSWYPKEIRESGRLSDHSDFFILFQGPYDSVDHVRISSAPSEISFFENSSEFVRECYSVAKILKNHAFCPFVIFDESNDTNEDDDDTDNDADNDIDDEKEKEESGCPIYVDSSKMDSLKYFNEDYKNSKHPIESWIIHMDDSKRVRKIFIPKNGSKDKIQNMPKSTEKIRAGSFSKGDLENEKGKNYGNDTHQVKYMVHSEKGKVTSNIVQKRITGAGSKESEILIQSGNTESEQVCEEQSEVVHESRYQATAHFSSHGQKLMKENNLNDDISWKGGDVVEADDEITSYMLKNSIMHVLKEKSKEEINNMTHQSVVIDVYKYLLECTERKCLDAVCMPYINILSYVDEHIKMLNEKELEDVVERRCFRIKCFCKVILGILQQEFTKEKDVNVQ